MRAQKKMEEKIKSKIVTLLNEYTRKLTKEQSVITSSSEFHYQKKHCFNFSYTLLDKDRFTDNYRFGIDFTISSQLNSFYEGERIVEGGPIYMMYGISFTDGEGIYFSEEYEIVESEILEIIDLSFEYLNSIDVHEIFNQYF